VDLVASPGDTWSALAEALASEPRLGRVAVFDAATMTTPSQMVVMLREALRARGTTVPVGGGSRAAFAELNRAELPLRELDFVTYGITPQAHHIDDDSIMDTLLAQPDTVRDAHRIAGGLPVVIGPVTLHPNRPDPRQASDFLAAWTLGSIAALAEGGAAAVTYFQTFGATGLATAAATYQVLSVFEAIAGLAGRPVHRLDAPTREVTVVAVGPIVLVANLRDIRRTIRLDGDVELAPYQVVVMSTGVAAQSGRNKSGSM
jgi:D-apionolactonase